MSGADSERGFRPGRWLLGPGWWTLPLLLCAALSLPWICGERWYSDASYYQAIATQMAREGTWWSPMQGEHPYFNKPPLAFWIHAALVLVFGDANWAAHLPEAIAFGGVCLLTAWMARRMHGPVVGVLAGCVMALTNEWIIRAGNFKLDSLHTLFVLAAVAFWIRAFVTSREPAPIAAPARNHDLRWALLAGICLGAALMTKPFYALGTGVLVIVWMWMARLLTKRRAAIVAVSSAIGVVIAAPWHLWMFATHGQSFIGAYIHEQTVQRAMGEMHDHQRWDWYLRLIAGTIDESIDPEKMWPIYGLAVLGMRVRWRDANRHGGDMLALLWTLAWFCAFSLFGGKRNYYLMVLHPATAWLAALWLGAVIASGQQRWGTGPVLRIVRGLAVIGLLTGVALLFRAPFVVAKERPTLIVPERNEFMSFIRAQHAAGRDIYDCGLSYRIASLAYIQAGFWPKCPSERTGFTPDAVPAGGLMAYRDDMVAKSAFGTFIDSRDRLVFLSSPNGQFTVYERHAGAQPTPPKPRP